MCVYAYSRRKQKMMKQRLLCRLTRIVCFLRGWLVLLKELENHPAKSPPHQPNPK